MTSKEKENLVALICTTFISLPYCIHIFSIYQSQQLSVMEELRFFASAILLLIPITIVAQIVVYILFTIAKAIVTNNDKLEPEITDERDTMIQLKSARVTGVVFAIGFILSLVALAAGSSVAVFFAILLVSGFACELFGILTKIYHYNKGV